MALQGSLRGSTGLLSFQDGPARLCGPLGVLTGLLVALCSLYAGCKLRNLCRKPAIVVFF